MCVFYLVSFAIIYFFFFFFFNHKPAFDMRISDWSSDVCSSDLPIRPAVEPCRMAAGLGMDQQPGRVVPRHVLRIVREMPFAGREHAVVVGGAAAPVVAPGKHGVGMGAHGLADRLVRAEAEASRALHEVEPGRLSALQAPTAAV